MRNNYLADCTDSILEGEIVKSEKEVGKLCEELAKATDSALGDDFSVMIVAWPNDFELLKSDEHHILAISRVDEATRHMVFSIMVKSIELQNKPAPKDYKLN